MWPTGLPRWRPLRQARQHPGPLSGAILALACTACVRQGSILVRMGDFHMSRKGHLAAGAAVLGLTALIYGFYGLAGAAVWLVGGFIIAHALATVRSP